MRTALLVIAATAVLACQRETPDVSQNQPSESSTYAGEAQIGTGNNTATMNPTVPTEIDDPNARTALAPVAQQVDLLEYRIDMPESVRAGRVVFDVENAGRENHAFEIEGNGIESRTEVLTRGNRARLEVDLKPGTYTVYCPVEGHAGKGMKRTVVVR